MARLSQVFAPRDREFFDLFEEAGANILRAADLLDRMLRNYPETKELAREILLCEQEGDRITHDIVNRLNSDLNPALSAPDVQERLAQLGLDWKGNTSGQFAAFLREEVQKWAKAVKDSGAKAD